MQNGENNKEALKMMLELAHKEIAPTVIKALFKGIYELDEASRAIVLRKAGAACAQAVRALREKTGDEYPTGVDLDTACEFMTRAAFSFEPLRRDFTCKKDGDTVVISDPVANDVFGSCGCVLVSAGLTEPNESLCRFCQEGHWMDQFEYMTGQQPERCEFPESYTMGDRYCVALCHFKPAK